MTYFSFLGIFLVIPILILGACLQFGQGWHRFCQQVGVTKKSTFYIIILHILLALVWTTAWDNYLVATGVWWYDPALVQGTTIGYVPIEEYTFFVLQPILTGLWLSFSMPYLHQASNKYGDSCWQFRASVSLVVGLVWLISIALLLGDYKQFTYLGLELIWALPPIILQLAFGADILWKQRRLVVFTIISATIFLSIADVIAIGMGTWTIDPMQSTGILLGGVLPIEELIFFLLTNSLIVFGMTLALADESKIRANYKLKENFSHFRNLVVRK